MWPRIPYRSKSRANPRARTNAPAPAAGGAFRQSDLGGGRVVLRVGLADTDRLTAQVDRAVGGQHHREILPGGARQEQGRAILPEGREELGELSLEAGPGSDEDPEAAAEAGPDPEATAEAVDPEGARVSGGPRPLPSWQTGGGQRVGQQADRPALEAGEEERRVLAFQLGEQGRWGQRAHVGHR